MSARWLLNLVLLLAVALAAAVLLFKPRAPVHETYKLVPQPLSQVNQIAIERGSNIRMLLARTDKAWRMQAPVAARLDETALARLLDLARVEVSSRLPADDLERYELDQPWARVRFGGHTIELGMTNGVTNELYARNGAYVYAIPARYVAAVPSIPARLLAHSMFAPDEVPAAFRLEGFALRHDGVRWQLDPPDSGLSQDDLVRWVDQWRLASSTTTQPGEGPASPNKVVVELTAGRSIAFAIVARTPELVLRREDEGLDYHFPSRTASLLLASPSTAAALKP